MNRAKTAAVAVLGQLLPDRIKRSLLHLSFHLAREEFERFAHCYCHAPDMKLGLTEMQNRGFFPSTIIDVGAFEGE